MIRFEGPTADLNSISPQKGKVSYALPDPGWEKTVGGLASLRFDDTPDYNYWWMTEQDVYRKSRSKLLDVCDHQGREPGREYKAGREWDAGGEWEAASLGHRGTTWVGWISLLRC